MKKLILMGLAVCCIMFMGCNDEKKEGKEKFTEYESVSKENDAKDTDEYEAVSKEDAIIASTGYEDGSVQRVYLYFEDDLYVFNDLLETITSDDFSVQYAEYEMIGEIKKIDNKIIPDENMEASRVDEGVVVYKKDDNVIIYDGEKYLWTMVKEE